ncbi:MULTISPECIES: hypothetical protein [unclassified Rhizobacter]|uniref:hypothetical protein n=1 Tax=unclassified Rhizobacter TaxID=2640088 RepID=UPI0006FF6347|nr:MULTISPECIES: hypothetical protein [unclassified Rhizobacter]KQU76014.1 hypothetical protein ASC88_24255 [Rhizobacter sp. Root29]KQW08731.1 hypothetical protein ASC98_24725 [Rhizobacter sp. Root1238]KRB16301.1 hypothetical protein ASE08_25605 [Rhizobacter sp. Root16D2]
MDTHRDQAFPRAAPCARCRRLRIALAGAVLVMAASLGLRAATVPPAAPASAPAGAPHTAPHTAPDTAMVPLAAWPAASAIDMRLVYKTVTLPSARRGAPYGPREVVKGGTPPYRFTVDGKLPPGLVLTEDGRLGGLPAENGSFRFVLGVQDAESPPRAAQQAYVLNVYTAASKPAAAASAASVPAAPRAMTTLGTADAEATANTRAGQPATYKLTPADQAGLVPEAAPPAPGLVPAPETGPVPADGPAPPAAVAPGDPAPVVPSAEQLQAVLLPLTDVEYPTRALFVDALEQSRCDYYRVHVNEMALKKQLSVDTRCPPQPAPAPASAPSRKPAATGLSLREFYDDLLPAALRDDIVKVAEKRHPFTDVKPLRLTGAGCGCTPQRTDNEVIGFVPYWLATEAPLAVDFSLFTRLEYMGVVLGDSGNWVLPPGWDGQSGGFARETRRHGTRVDLVLYRRDWASLLALPEAQADAVARNAARNAVVLADTHHTDLQSRFDGLLLPQWRESAYVYDGITVFFEDSPTEGPQQKAFARFLKLFLQRLVAEMQASGRSYQANIVVPDHLLGDTGAYNFSDLMDVLESAEPRRSSKGVEEGAKVRYRGTTDLTVDFLVLLSEPTGASTMALRAQIDATPNLAGHRRIAFLESVVPIEFHQRGDKPVLLAPPERDQLDRDLAYIKWTYGGIGLWPLPTTGLGSGETVSGLLAHNYTVPRGALAGLCEFACPNRLPLRLLFEALVLAECLGIALYAWNCRVRRIGRRYLLMLWAGALATLALAFVVFSCDPALQHWREQNYLLYGLILLLFAAGVYVTFKPRVEAP